MFSGDPMKPALTFTAELRLHLATAACKRYKLTSSPEFRSGRPAYDQAPSRVRAL